MIKGLSFFDRCSDGSLNIASYHNPASLTWRWMVNVGRFGSGFPRKFGVSYGYRQLHIGLWFFRVLVATQRSMRRAP